MIWRHFNHIAFFIGYALVSNVACCLYLYGDGVIRGWVLREIVSTMKKKYYAVKKGVIPGIYSSWRETEQQVKGFSGAVYKGFATLQEAKEWYEGQEPQFQSKAKFRRTASPQGRQLPELGENEIHVYTDGGCQNNPGPGGYGVVIIAKEGLRELSEGYRLTTNNRMELLACIIALEEVQDRSESVQLYSDSSYVVNGIEKGWAKKWSRNGWKKSDGKAVLNKDLWQRLINLTVNGNVHFNWVKGHAGNPLNERCDRLAVQASKGKSMQIDREYERVKGV